jgi:hypothetical protein
MKTIDLTRETLTLGDLLALAKEGAVLIHSASGEDYFLEQADDFQREAAELGASEAFMSFLRDRAQEKGTVTLDEARRKRGM